MRGSPSIDNDFHAGASGDVRSRAYRPRPERHRLLLEGVIWFTDSDGYNRYASTINHWGAKGCP
jgi:hypothetical protein